MSGLSDNPPRVPNAPLQPHPPRRRRSKEPKPFTGLIHKPLCEACEKGADERPKAPGSPPPAHLHPRPPAHCRHPQALLSRSRLCLPGLARPRQHPRQWPSWRSAWRQLQCVSCHGYFSETHGTIFHGKRASSELIVRVIACLAEGLGIRGTARVFEINPTTVLDWLVEATEQLEAFSAYFLNELQINQVQLDELYAVLSAVRDGEVSEAEAVERLSRSPHWVWTAIDPESKLLLSVQVGERTLAMAQAVLHQIAQRLAPGLCTPLFERWLPQLPARHRVALRPLGAAASAPGERPRAHAALDAAARAALRPSRQKDATAAPRRGEAPGRVRHARRGGKGLGRLRLADQHVVCGEAQPESAPAGGSDRAAQRHAV